MHSLDFGSLWYTAKILLDEQRVGVVLLKDHDQVVQHGDVSVESQSYLVKFTFLCRSMAKYVMPSLGMLYFILFSNNMLQ